MLKPILLSNEERERLFMPINGKGGMQTLLRTLQYGVGDDDSLTVTMETLIRVFDYGDKYGPGGFQWRFAGLGERIARQNGLDEMFGLDPLD